MAGAGVPIGSAECSGPGCRQVFAFVALGAVAVAVAGRGGGRLISLPVELCDVEEVDGLPTSDPVLPCWRARWAERGRVRRGSPAYGGSGRRCPRSVHRMVGVSTSATGRVCPSQCEESVR
jgi:hypothetical protein